MYKVFITLATTIGVLVGTFGQAYASSNTMYTTANLNVRDSPSLEGEVVDILEFNEKVSVVSEEFDGWYAINYEGNIRYVCKDYLREEMATYKSYSVSDDTGYKSYMDGKCITSKSSPQYKLKSSYEISDYGVYTVDGRYCIAMGSYYADKIGTKIDLVLRNEDEDYVLQCVLGDQKANRDTDSQNKKHKSDGSYVEMIVKTDEMPRKARQMGDASYAGDIFKGKVVEVRVYE